ncbi:MAG: DUF4382 domain-containing protein [Spirochaetales bacterium]|nr:DUF4382 domain-containing protein [Spirochaetales bacterium]
MKNLPRIAILVGILAALAGLWGCQVDSPAGILPTGTVRLSLTDAAVDNPAIDGVWLTIGEIQYNLGGDDSLWQSFDDFEGPQAINLMDYQNGLAYQLGNLELPSGQYNQIRFLLDIPDQGVKAPPVTPGCRITFNDGTPDAPLFVPSGLQTGYKAVGSFTVPVNATVDITADFDLHKALRLTANGERYLLQPTIRLIVNNQAGAIAGTVVNLPAEQVKLLAYADATYDPSEAAALPEQFPGSVTSAEVNPATHTYKIAFLAAGTYDLVVATVDPVTTTLLVQGFVPDLTVESEQTTHQDIDMNALDADTVADPAP